MSMTEGTSVSYDFTADWFSKHIPMWSALVPLLPGHRKFLEVGSFEGRSAVWLLENMIEEDGQLFCIDTWQGSPEFHVLPEDSVKGSFKRFQHNIALARGPKQRVHINNNRSIHALAGLMDDHADTFDFAYIDGSHMASDVLSDACLTFGLMKLGGIMVFDDYLWDLREDVLNRPKMAIDAFTSMFNRKIRLMGFGEQLIIKKVNA